MAVCGRCTATAVPGAAPPSCAAAPRCTSPPAARTSHWCRTVPPASQTTGCAAGPTPPDGAAAAPPCTTRPAPKCCPLRASRAPPCKTACGCYRRAALLMVDTSRSPATAPVRSSTFPPVLRCRCRRVHTVAPYAAISWYSAATPARRGWTITTGIPTTSRTAGWWCRRRTAPPSTAPMPPRHTAFSTTATP